MLTSILPQIRAMRNGNCNCAIHNKQQQNCTNPIPENFYTNLVPHLFGLSLYVAFNAAILTGLVPVRIPYFSGRVGAGHHGQER